MPNSSNISFCNSFQYNLLSSLRSTFGTRCDPWGNNNSWFAPRPASFCLQAPQLFEGMDQQGFLAVLSEVGAVGQRGLQINEPGNSHSLKTLPVRLRS